MQRQAVTHWFVWISSCLVVVASTITCFAASANAQGAKAVEQRKTASNGHKQWYPYIVPAGYVDPKTASSEGIVRPFGHGLYLVLVKDLNGLVGNISEDDLKRANTTPKAAYTQAYANLEKLLESNRIQMAAYPKGPNQAPFIVMGGHWCSAACIVLPGIYELAKKALHSEQVVAIIPHRDVLLLFPKPDKAGLDKLREFAKEKEGDGRKPLSFEPFELTKTGPVALK